MLFLVFLLNAFMAYCLGRIIIQNIDVYGIGMNFLYLLSYIEIKLKEVGLIEDSNKIEDIDELVLVLNGDEQVKLYPKVIKEMKELIQSINYDTVIYNKIEGETSIIKNIVREKLEMEDMESLKECEYLFLNININIKFVDGTSDNLDVKLKSNSMNFNFYYIDNEFSQSFWKYYLFTYFNISNEIDSVILNIMDDNIITHIIDKTEVLKLGEEKLIIKKI